MDNEKLKQFTMPIALLVLLIAGICWFSPKIIENINSYTSVRNEIDQKQETIEQKQIQLDNYKKQASEEAAKEKQAASQTSEKPFYKPVMSGLDTESVIAGEFAEILQLVRANKIKVRSIKYDYDPQDDNFVKFAKDKYNVARLNMEMIGSYTDYDNFLKEMYKHEHFLDIQSAEIVPYKKNKKVLLINFKVKLYAKK